MKEKDPLEETDIYSGEKHEEAPEQRGPSSEELEMDEDIGNLLNRSFTQEKSKSSLV